MGSNLYVVVNKVLGGNYNGTNYDFESLSRMVSPKGFEPPSLVPETKILSIELRRQSGEDKKLCT
jgi:hypothetical protein